jgi:DNA-binding CsgD family transcriptional regulator
VDEGLQPHELSMLRLVAAGWTNAAIARELGYARKSVEAMLSCADPHRAIYAKIGVRNRAEAAAWYTARFDLPRRPGQRPNPAADRLLRVYTDYAQRIYQVRVGGNPQLAIDMAAFLSDQVQDTLPEAPCLCYQEALLRLEAQAWLEGGTAHLETALPHEVVGKVQPIVHQIAAAAQQAGDGTILAQGYLLLGGASNIAHDYARGRAFYAQALGCLDTVELQLRAWRGLAIAAAYRQDPEAVEAATSQVRRLIDGGRFSRLEQVCETLEGLGKAQGVVGLATAYAWLEEAEGLLDRIQRPPLRALQLVVSRLEVIRRLDPGETTARERLGSEGLALARAHGYVRHIHLIETLLEAPCP